MDSFTDFFPELFAVAALLLAAIALTPVAHALRLPAPVAFLAVGVAAGAVDLLPTDRLGELRLEQIGAVALYGVLFQGGLATGFRAWRSQARPILALGTVGTGLTAAALTAVAHWVLGLDWALAALVGVALSPTDPAAVYALLRGGGTDRRARVILEGESGFNDPVSISLMVAAVEFLATDDATVAHAAVRVAEEMGIGLVGGALGGALVIALLRATPRLEDSLQAVTVLTAVVVVGAATASLHGSGFLAVYVAGLLVADAWAEQDGERHAIPEAVAAAAEPVLFGLLGAVFVTRVGGRDVLDGVVLTLATVLVVRPLAVAACLVGAGFTRAGRLVVAVGGLKGAVPLLLAGYPALEALPEAHRTEAIVLCATAASLVLQGWGLSLVTSRTTQTSE